MRLAKLPCTGRLPLIFLAAAALVLSPAAAGPLDAQEGISEATPEGTEGLPFMDRVDVDVVNVEVFVTDRDGQRVTGLQRDDFEIRVDGEAVPVSNFHVSRELRRSEAPAEIPVTGAGVPDPLPASAEETGTSRTRPLSLVVYVDNVNLTPVSRKRVLDDLRTLIADRASGGDGVMVVGYDGGLHVEQPLTTDAAALMAALDRIERQTTRRQISDINLRQSLDRALGGASSGLPGAIEAEIARYREEQLNQALGAYKSLHAVVRGLAGLPGRKAVLYVSEGIPRSPGSELATMVAAALGGGGGPTLANDDADLHRYYRRIAREANAHETTLYTLDARGSQSSLFLGADSPGSVGVTADADFARDVNLQEPLLDMADYTGGQAILNTTNFAGAFDAVEEDFESFYSLGFLSPTGGDGEYHDIEVRVKEPSLRVRHRPGYLDKGRLERVADRTTAFLLQQWESNPMGVKLGFGEPKKKRRHWNVPLVVRIPAGSLTLLPKGDRSVGRVQLFVASQDDEGGLSEVTRVPRDVEVSTEQLARAREAGEVGDVGYAVEVALRPGPANLVVGVLDEIGGTESYVYQKVVVGGG